MEEFNIQGKQTSFTSIVLERLDTPLYSSVRRNGAGLPPIILSTNTTGKGLYSVSLGSIKLPPIR